MVIYKGQFNERISRMVAKCLNLLCHTSYTCAEMFPHMNYYNEIQVDTLIEHYLSTNSLLYTAANSLIALLLNVLR